MPFRGDGEHVDGGAATGGRGLLGKFGARAARSGGEAIPNLHTREALLLLQNYEESGRGWFWSTDTKGRLTYITDAVARLMGRSSGELLGTPLTDLFLPPESHGERQRTLPFLLTRQSKFDDLPPAQRL